MAFIEIKTDIKTYYIDCLSLTIGENEVNILFKDLDRTGVMNFKKESSLSVVFAKTHFYNKNLGGGLFYIKKENGDYLYKF